MGSPVSILAPGVSAAGVPATAKITVNVRVKTTAGPVGLLADVMQFPGPPVVGNWVVAAGRTFVTGIPVVNQASTGTSFGPPSPVVPPPTGPMIVTAGDPRVSAL
jgi:hypothetical protein